MKHRGDFWVYPEGFLVTGGSVGLGEFLEDSKRGDVLRPSEGLQGQLRQGGEGLGQRSLDLLVDGFQLLLKHDGERLHIGLSAGGEQLSPKHPLSLLLV